MDGVLGVVYLYVGLKERDYDTVRVKRRIFWLGKWRDVLAVEPSSTKSVRVKVVYDGEVVRSDGTIYHTPLTTPQPVALSPDSSRR